MSRHVQIDGVKALQAKFARDIRRDSVRQVVRMHTGAMQQKAMRYAPYETGNLRRNIRLSLKDGGKMGVVSSEARYAPYMEYGTRYVYPRRHIAPAFEQQAPLFMRDLRKLVD